MTEPASTSEDSHEQATITFPQSDRYRAAGFVVISKDPVTQESVVLLIPESRLRKAARIRLSEMKAFTYETTKVALSFPGGKIENEDKQCPLTTALRELTEETRGVFRTECKEISRQVQRDFPHSCLYETSGKYYIFFVIVEFKEVFKGEGLQPDPVSGTFGLSWVPARDLIFNRQKLALHEYTRTLLDVPKIRILLGLLKAEIEFGVTTIDELEQGRTQIPSRPREDRSYSRRSPRESEVRATPPLSRQYTPSRFGGHDYPPLDGQSDIDNNHYSTQYSSYPAYSNCTSTYAHSPYPTYYETQTYSNYASTYAHSYPTYYETQTNHSTYNTYSNERSYPEDGYGSRYQDHLRHRTNQYHNYPLNQQDRNPGANYNGNAKRSREWQEEQVWTPRARR